MNKLFLWIAAASAFVLQSCENTDGIRDEIGSLRDRVIALEAKIGSVNTSIVALHKLMDESTIIVGIEPNAKGYEIELSDGTRLPVILGEKIEALVPVMGIDAEGYWTVSLDGGATSERLKVGGEYVSAWPVSGGDHKPGAEGVTPQLKVSADGEWLVSLDGGATYAPLLQNGQPVNALGDKVVVSYSSAFKSVTYDATTGLLAVELLDGEKLTLPVFDDFGLTVTASDNETFRLGETRAFEVVQNNVAEAVIDAPAGWTAVLGETTLTVKAPATFDAASQQAAVSVTVYSDRKYRKLVTLNVTLLDERGEEYRSVEFALWLQKRLNSGVKRLVLVIGGPYGFSDEVYRRADAKLSLSRMTFSHQIVRAIFAEQIYRAFTILNNEPYHHE